MAATIENYGDLKNAVKTYLNRNDEKTISQIPRFIGFAEKMFPRMISLPFYETNYDWKWDSTTNPFIPIPNDFLHMKHIWVDSTIGYHTQIHLTRVDVETFKNLEQTRQDLRRPQYFCRIGAEIHVFPQPLEGETVHMIYQRDIDEMKNDTDAPYSLVTAPEVMLYLALRHASIFIRDNDQEQYWMQKASDAVTSLMTLLDDSEWAGSSLVVRQFDTL